MDTTQLKTKVIYDYTKKNKQLLDEWSEKTAQTFLEQCRKFTEEMYSGNLTMVDDGYNQTQEELLILENLFKNYTKTKGDIQHKLRIGYSIARKLYMENLQQRVFRVFRQQVKYQKYIRNMKVYAVKHYKQRFPSQIFTKWRKLAHSQTRQAILQQVNRKTDNEIMQMQKEYEQLIGQLENVLEKKLIELKVEEEQHKELVLRYDGIVEKRTAAENGHKFQIRAIVIMSLQFMVAGMFHIAIKELYFHQTFYKCIDQQFNLQQCIETEFCNQYQLEDIDKRKNYFSFKLGDIIQFFQLVCNDKIIILIVITFYYIGGCIGSLYYGEQMDIRQGRKSIMIVTLTLLGFTCCSFILIQNAYLFSVALFFANFFLRGFLNSSMILFLKYHLKIYKNYVHQYFQRPMEQEQFYHKLILKPSN